MEKMLVESCDTVVTVPSQRQLMTPEKITESVRTLYKALEAFHRAAGQPPESIGPGFRVPDNPAALRRQSHQTFPKHRSFV